MKRNLQQGFTLLEIMVSMVVTVIVVGLLIYVARSSFTSLTDGTNDIGSYQSAQLVMEQLSSDFESMEFQGDNSQWLAAEAINTSAAHDASGTDNYNNDTVFEPLNGNPPENGYFTRLAFFTKALDRYNGILNQPGDIACVEYGLAYSDPTGTDTDTFILYRQIIDPNYTYNNLLKQVNAGADGVMNTADDTPQDLLGLLDINRDKTTILSVPPSGPPLFQQPCYLNNPAFIVCDNIKEFSITFHVQYVNTQGQNAITRVPVIEVNDAGNKMNKVEKFVLNGTQFVVTNNSSTANVALNDIAAANGGNIVAIDINLQVLNDEGRALLQAGAPDHVIEQKVDRFTKTIHLPLIHGNSL